MKDYGLEAARGVAALVVLASHVLLGFYPAQAYVLEPWGLHGLVNGSAAVTFFFVLSGFVLTRKYFVTGRVEILYLGAVKRWPRLAAPVLLSTLVSYAFIATDLYRFDAASAITGSSWLQRHLQIEGVGIGDAIWLGLTTFFTGDHSLNTNLWTMYYEFFGSLIAFALAWLSIFHRSATLIIAVIILLVLRNNAYLLIPFPLGVILAALLPKGWKSLNGALCGGTLLFAVYLLGYRNSGNPAYDWLRQVPAYLVVNLASLLIIAALHLYDADGLNRPWARLLGIMSFPVYLVQVPVLCSIGSLSLLASGSPAVATIATLVSTIVIAIPLAIFNEWWAAFLDKAVKDNLSRRDLFARII